MKVLLSLTVLSLTLAFCHGACFRALHKIEYIDGVVTEPEGCVDIYDDSFHPLGSTWYTDRCLRCSCSRTEMECCTRYGGVVDVRGCKAVVDPEMCKFVLYKEDDPTKLCDYQL